MDKGWVKLHRRTLENHFLMHDDKAFAVFTKLLMIVGSEKGQWSGGRVQLANILVINPNTLYKVLQRLEKQQLISVNSNSRYTEYTICNWSKYQTSGNRTFGNKQQHSNSTATAQQHSYKNKKENKNIYNDDEKTTEHRASRDTVLRIRQQLIERKILS